MNDKEQRETISIDDTDNQVTDTSVEDSVSNTNDIIEKLNEKIAELNDKYLRTVAELENTRRRAVRDTESATRSCSISLVRHFLPVMDAIDSALKHAPDDAGIKSMSLAMETAFENVGIKRIESIGQILNPGLHNAIQVADKPNADIKSNTIIEEMQCGYTYGDTVIRPAMVIVCK